MTRTFLSATLVPLFALAVVPLSTAQDGANLAFV
jgi:hypothetical protein